MKYKNRSTNPKRSFSVSGGSFLRLGGIFVLLAFVGSLNVHAQTSTRREKAGARATGLEQVVRMYCRYARTRQIDRLKQLVVKRAKNAKPQEEGPSGGEAPSYDILAVMDRRFLEEQLPSTISTGRYQIVSVAVRAQRKSSGSLYAKLRSTINHSELTLVFDLSRSAKAWRIFRAQYDTLNRATVNASTSSAPDTRRSPKEVYGRLFA